ncbi:MAG: hypothetical protein AAF489_12555 [Bacteroidota bacterium]
MKFFSYLLILLILPVTGAFNAVESDKKETLIKKWVFVDSNDQGILYKSHAQLKEDKGGMEFMRDGTMVVRQNAGWCGTPPITYANFPGTWTASSKKEVALEYEYWGGTIKSTMTIVKLDKNELLVKFERNELIRSND